MSIRLMAAVYACQIGDLKYKHNNTKKSVVEEKTIKASVAKSVLLAYADHANDEGRATYPSITTLEKKTELSHQTIVNAQKALNQNGFIVPMGISHRGTKEYAISIEKLQESIPLTSSSQRDRLAVVNGIDSNRPLTAPEPSSSANAEKRKPQTIEEAIFSGQPTTLDMLDQEKQFQADVDMACFQICQNNMHLEPLARAFMESRHIILDPKKRSGHIKALKEMHEAKPNRVKPEHITEAIHEAKDSGIANNIVDLYGIIRMAIGKANAIEENTQPAYQDQEPSELEKRLKGK